ncbi:MAG: HPF/RaiA family ribosome-associated protein [Spirochaetales bacterium]|jgi:putative sigma-54 modulation protein|nr:HPF/RaiA family ribosome-associated protein [Spirochaetales bacterium]
MMNIEIKGIHYELSEKTLEQFQKKMKRLEFASDFIKTLEFSVEREKSLYNLSADFTFTGGNPSHLHISSHNLYEGIDLIIDKVENKISKEKEKMQNH